MYDRQATHFFNFFCRVYYKLHISQNLDFKNSKVLIINKKIGLWTIMYFSN